MHCSGHGRFGSGQIKLLLSFRSMKRLSVWFFISIGFTLHFQVWKFESLSNREWVNLEPDSKLIGACARLATRNSLSSYKLQSQSNIFPCGYNVPKLSWKKLRKAANSLFCSLKIREITYWIGEKSKCNLISVWTCFALPKANKEMLEINIITVP